MSRYIGIFVGCVVGAVVWYFLAQLVPDSTCLDGSTSGAIGIQGACSHHGGVDSNSPIAFLAFLGGIVAGVAVGFFSYKASARLPQPKGMIKTPYGSLREYEAHLRKLGITEDQVRTELRKYKG